MDSEEDGGGGEREKKGERSGWRTGPDRREPERQTIHLEWGESETLRSRERGRVRRTIDPGDGAWGE